MKIAGVIERYLLGHTALLALTLAISAAASGLPAQALRAVNLVGEDHAPDEAAVEKVMADFHAAVAAHDGERVTSLSVAEGSTWFNVLSDEGICCREGEESWGTERASFQLCRFREVCFIDACDAKPATH
jgi:hypothetical protein